MYQILYTIARWTEYVAGALAVLSLITIGVRLIRRPRRPVLQPACAFAITGALCAGMILVLAGRVQQVRLDSIKALGLERNHSGLRTNALIYQTQVSIPVSLKALPSSFPGGGFVNGITGFLYHHTTTVQAQVAVYGLIDFKTVGHQVATVDRETRTITLALPNPTIGPNTTYIWSVAGIQEREGPLTSVVANFTGPLDALLGRPLVSADPRPALARAKSAALTAARHSQALASCGKEEITQQLTEAFNLTPAYRGFTVQVRWPTPPVAKVNCAQLQQQLAHTQN